MKTLHRLSALSDRLSLRERILAVLAVCVALFLGIHLLLLRPLAARNAALTVKIKSDKADAAALIAVNLALEGRRNSQMTEERAELERQLARVDRAETPLRDLVGDSGLQDLVRTRLGPGSALSLVAFRNLPAEVFFNSTTLTPGKPVSAVPATPPAQPLAAAAPELVVYRHGAEISVKGKYPDLLAYLQSGRQTGSGLFWSQARIDAVEYPYSVLTVTVHRLSYRPVLPL